MRTLSSLVGSLALALTACASPLGPTPDIGPEPETEHDSSVVVEAESSARPVVPSPESPKPAAGKSAGFKLPADFAAATLDGAGDEIYFVPGGYRDEGQVGRITRSGDQIVSRGPGGIERIRVLGSGANQQAVAVGTLGGMARYRSGSWEYQLAPALEGEALGGAEVGPDGTLYLAGEHHALYVAKGDTWTVHRYGSTGTAVMECVLAKDGTLMLVGRHGRVLSFDGSSFKDVSIQGLSAGSLAHKWVDAWMDRKRMTLWIVAAKMLIELDLAAKTARMHSSRLFFDLQTVTGADTPSGALIMVGTFGATALFDGTSFFEADDDGATSLYIDVKRAQGYAADHGKVRAVDLAHPWLGTGPGKPITR